ncbi:hypothetical protein EJ110_NYTH24956 [Nymphaea thermarum]|nr:hypothetical protein EJ110_NYTH24956 [Nymphaea thermarum]
MILHGCQSRLDSIYSICYLTLCDRSYPNKLAFQYVLDLKNEFERVNGSQIETTTKPYAFTRFVPYKYLLPVGGG